MAIGALVVQGDRWFCGHWFYKTVDTALAINGKNIFSAIDSRRIFRASEYDNTKGYDTVYPFAVINRCLAATCCMSLLHASSQPKI